MLYIFVSIYVFMTFKHMFSLNKKKKKKKSCPVLEETVVDTKVLDFSLMRSFIVPFDLAIVNRKQRSFFVSFFFFFFERRKRCTLKR